MQQSKLDLALPLTVVTVKWNIPVYTWYKGSWICFHKIYCIIVDIPQFLGNHGMWCDYGSWGFTCPWDFHNMRNNNRFNAPSGSIEPDKQTMSHNLSSSYSLPTPAYGELQTFSTMVRYNLSVVSVGELIIHEIWWQESFYVCKVTT